MELVCFLWSLRNWGCLICPSENDIVGIERFWTKWVHSLPVCAERFVWSEGEFSAQNHAFTVRKPAETPSGEWPEITRTCACVLACGVAWTPRPHWHCRFFWAEGNKQVFDEMLIRIAQRLLFVHSNTEVMIQFLDSSFPWPTLETGSWISSAWDNSVAKQPKAACLIDQFRNKMSSYCNEFVLSFCRENYMKRLRSRNLRDTTNSKKKNHFVVIPCCQFYWIRLIHEDDKCHGKGKNEVLMCKKFLCASCHCSKRNSFFTSWSQ